MNSATSIQTFTGLFFDPFAPDPDKIRIEDIAHALALQCRFSGHVRKRWSVAEHSLLVADLCPPELRLDGLMHDASEAYLVDIPRPIKHDPRFHFYLTLESQVEHAIALKFGLKAPLPAVVKDCDNTVLVAEAKALKHGLDGWIEHKRSWKFELVSGDDDGELVRAIRDARPPTDQYVIDEFRRAFYAFGGK